MFTYSCVLRPPPPPPFKPPSSPCPTRDDVDVYCSPICFLHFSLFLPSTRDAIEKKRLPESVSGFNQIVLMLLSKKKVK